MYYTLFAVVILAVFHSFNGIAIAVLKNNLMLLNPTGDWLVYGQTLTLV